MEEMERAYDPQALEKGIYARWEAAGYFEPRGDGAPYSIVLPPPNVTGTLHMGHAFQATLMDALVRHHRMRGECVLWQPGTDHAGIATQMVVERRLAAEGTARSEMKREAFVERVWQWRRESGGHIQRQFRRLGASLAWERELFTLDPGPAAAVAETFVRLYDAGLIYRGQRLVNWDPVLQTALSDLEVANEEENGFLWYIRYPFVEGDGGLTVATTRPETMLGDAAVAVNPDDERFGQFVGRRLRLPITGREIPVIADAHVDPEFGTGCVKVTPAHDFNDYAIGQRHHLPLINVFTKEARIVSNRAADWHAVQKSGNPPQRGAVSGVVDLAADIGIPDRLQGLDRHEARQRIVAELEAAGLLEKTEPHKLKVPRGDRSGATLEPWLTDQWFVDLTREQHSDGRPGGLAAITRPAIAAVREGRIRFVPENWSRTYFQWLENIQDWCISRQLWWGHQIPAWYDAAGNVYVGRDEVHARARAGLRPEVVLTRDADVLDTWFSSALWPLTTLGWPRRTPDLAAFYPTSVLVTGFDIIFFWVARMVMMGLYLSGEIPFREVYVHGLIRDEHGQKMSKSKGNVLDPIDLVDGIGADALVEKRTAGMMQPQLAARVARATRKEFPDGIAAYGTDALRFTFAALASPGRDINFDLGRIGGYRNFCNKLWNATRFVLMNVERAPAAPAAPDVADRWIRSVLARTIAEVRTQLGDYRFDLAAKALYEFAWSEFCDWYLELAKPRLGGDDADAAEAARHTLVTVLEAFLRLLHPVMPFISEALWQRVAPLAGRSGESVMVAPCPRVDEFAPDPESETEIAWLRQFVGALRQIRSELGLDPGRRMPVQVHAAEAATRKRVASHAAAIAFLARSEAPVCISGDAPETAATAVVDGAVAAVPLAGLIDPAVELARLDKAVRGLEADLERIRAKLADASFRTRAPAEVVERERRRLEENEAALDRYRVQRERVARLA